MTMKLRPLLEILADGNFHSGEQIGLALSISRTAVWKKIDKLRSMGVEIHSVTGKGYRIPVAVCLLDKRLILELLGRDSETWASRLEVLFSTTSTNADAMFSAQQGLDFNVHVAEHQTEGKGRRGKEWRSPLGSNIYFSMLVSFPSGVAALDGLSLAVAVLVVGALRASGYSGFGLKWPNDILLDGKKLAGILLEITGDVAGPCKVVIGIGINTHLSASIRHEIDQPVIDLAEKFSSPPDRNVIVANLIRALANGVSKFETQGFSAYQAQWQELDLFKGQHVRVGIGRDAVEGLVEGIDHKGALVLRTSSGIRVICSGELIPTMRAL